MVDPESICFQIRGRDYAPVLAMAAVLAIATATAIAIAIAIAITIAIHTLGNTSCTPSQTQPISPFAHNHYFVPALTNWAPWSRHGCKSILARIYTSISPNFSL